MSANASGGPPFDRDAKIWELVNQGICFTCRDLETHEVFGDLPVIYEDALFTVTLSGNPLALGETVVAYKLHRDDMSALTDAEAARVMDVCVKTMNALKRGLGAEKVYLITMCDGPINHLHFTLVPRYPGEHWGFQKFLDPRAPLTDGEATARRVRAVLEEVGLHSA